MRNRASLMLMEQLLMILVFSLACAVCLQVFVKGDRISRQTAQKDMAVYLAQNAAEIIKGAGGNLEMAALEMGAVAEGSGWEIRYDKDGRLEQNHEKIQFHMEIVRDARRLPFLGEVSIQVYGTDDLETPLFTLPVAWQEME